MNIRFIVATASAIFLLMGSHAWADEGEATIRLMSNAEAELPDAVTREIKLPAFLTEDVAAVENAANGLSNTNQQRSEEGLANAAEARERGAEMAEAAQENRENQGRSNDRPVPPERPDVPQPPRGN